MSDSSSASLRNLVLSGILIVLLSGIWLVTNNVTLAPNTNATNSSAIQTLPTIQCDFVEKLCLSTSQSQQVSLTIDSEDIRSFTPLPFKLEFKGVDPNSVSIDFKGIEMFMGAHLLKLKKQTDNSFTGNISLAGHNGYSMTWRAIVTYISDKRTEQVWFEFVLE